MGWAGATNGKLLSLAEAHGFEVLVTADQSLPYQQNLSKRGIAFIVLATPDNRIETQSPMVPAIVEALKTIRPGEVVVLSPETQ
jgi:hypothetical protein